MAGISCEHCCGAEQVFDLKEAKKQLKHYHKKGPRKTSRKLIQAIKFLSSNDKSLLEIGGGIGADDQDHLGRLDVAHHGALDEVHDIEQRVVDCGVGAQPDRGGDRHVGRCERGDDPFWWSSHRRAWCRAVSSRRRTSRLQTGQLHR